MPVNTALESLGAKEAINAAIDLLHRRWVMRIIWELRGGALTFRELQSACGDLSPTVLNQRLRELRQAQLIEHAPGDGYGLSEHGQRLLVAMQPMLQWSVRWWRAAASPD